MEKLKVGSLFAGIGGFDYGLELAGGFQIEWQIEIDPFCQQVLAKHWPNATRYGDIQKCGIGRKHELSHIDVLCGGFPCQPHSLAGQRKASEDERDLWSEFYRLIRELKPRWVVAENVLGLLSSEDGAFFSGVLRDLAKAGYDAEWRVLRASDVGAPHRRERVFIVAHTSGTGWQECDTAPISSYSGHITWRDYTPNDVENTTGRREWQHQSTRRENWTQSLSEQSGARIAQSRICRVFDGLSTGMDRYNWPAGPGEEQHSWEPPRVVTGRQKDRGKRLKALGNAIVPQLVAEIGRAIISTIDPITK